MKTCASLSSGPGSNSHCSNECLPINCDCKDGFYTNKCNQCVPRDKCHDSCDMPPIICPGKNEELVPCFDPRSARICKPIDPGSEPSYPAEDSPFPLDLLDAFGWMDKPNESCIVSICDCKWNFRRNKCGICVKSEDCHKECKAERCDSCSDPNELRYKKWRLCRARSCDNLNNPLTCSNELDKVLRNKCDCKPDYYRDDCGRCVPEAECTNQRPCKCTNPCNKVKSSELSRFNSCSRRTCFTETLPVLMRCKPDVHADCNCVEGYYLNKDFDCVQKKDCTKEDIRETDKLFHQDDVISDHD